MAFKRATIAGTGSYLPTKVLTNRDLEQLVETSDEWIVTRTGIRERRIAAHDEFTSEMGAKAAMQALLAANKGADEIDCILVATLTPDYLFPSTACLIQKILGAKKAAALDIQAACTGYLYGLSLAKAMVESGQYKNILLIAAEKLSSITDYQDRSTCILFGDGASAAVISEGGFLSIGSIDLGCDGEAAELLMMPAGGCRKVASQESLANKEHYIKMAGNEVFKHAVRRMESAVRAVLEKNSLAEEDIGWLIPHQANLRIIDAIAKRFHHLPDDQILRTVEKYGNTSASSVGIALDELVRSGRLHKGQKVLLTAFGSGFTWGAAVLEVL